MTRGAASRALAAWLVALGACASPEASRERGGGPGADVGNYGGVIEFHAGAEPYYQTPCVQEPECSGPLPVFDRTQRRD